MMEKTDRHYRYFIRQISRHILLYTEMITTGAIAHGHRDYLLAFEPIEHPISLQLGGDDPEELYQAIRIASDYGYDEYNINIGCPSDRVQNANFGACLMADPPRVRELVAAMKAATEQPVTVKHRIGIDGRESYEELREFVAVVNEQRPDRFTVHARIAILGGLSPKENRNIPPIRYEDVYRLKRELPELRIEINGHIKTPDEIAHHLQYVDGVMIGRAAYDDPWMLASVDERFFRAKADDPRLFEARGVSGAVFEPPTRARVIETMREYIDRWAAAGWPDRNILRHMLGLFGGVPGTRKFKQRLSVPIAMGTGARALAEAAAHIPDEFLHARPE